MCHTILKIYFNIYLIYIICLLLVGHIFVIMFLQQLYSSKEIFCRRVTIISMLTLSCKPGVVLSVNM